MGIFFSFVHIVEKKSNRGKCNIVIQKDIWPSFQKYTFSYSKKISGLLQPTLNIQVKAGLYFDVVCATQ